MFRYAKFTHFLSVLFYLSDTPLRSPSRVLSWQFSEILLNSCSVKYLQTAASSNDESMLQHEPKIKSNSWNCLIEKVAKVTNLHFLFKVFRFCCCSFLCFIRVFNKLLQLIYERQHEKLMLRKLKIHAIYYKTFLKSGIVLWKIPISMLKVMPYISKPVDTRRT